MGHGFLHWSANFDEVQDFEGQIRSLAGGTGLMSDPAFATGTRSSPLGDPKAGISSDLDALAAYPRLALDLSTRHRPDPMPPRCRARARPASRCSPTSTARRATPASPSPAAARRPWVDIGTLKPTSGSRLGGPLPGIDIPTLRDVWATAPYLHDGSAPTLEAAVQAHRGVSIAAADLTNLAQYLREIGSDEAAPVAKSGTGTGLQGDYFANNSVSGTPVLTRIEAVDFDWGEGSPASVVPVDNF